MPAVIPGIESAAADDFSTLKGAAVGLLSNQASVNRKGNHLTGLLKNSRNCKLIKRFAPEHGYLGKAQDMVAISNENEPETGTEIISLYGDSVRSLNPAKEDFTGLDVLVIDLPDIGTRYYTYSQTMAYCMKMAGEAGVKVVVLDRPNPIGGNQIEGSPLPKACRSFCGIGPIANRHGMTLGELAGLFRDGFGEGEAAIEKHQCELEVIPVQGWKRSMYFDETNIPWVRPSPNIATLETAVVYPGACLFEATNLSEGRGTTCPFEILGAPFINPESWVTATEEVDVPIEGASLRPIEFTPQFQKHKGQLCQGVQIQVHDRLTFQPYRFGIALLVAAARTFPKDFSWRTEPYEFIENIPAIDLLYGDETLRRVAEGISPIEEILTQMETFEDWYHSARIPHLLY